MTMSESKPEVWTCKVGDVGIAVPDGGDLPMRAAIRKAFTQLTGHSPDFIFSGWGGDLDAIETDIAYRPRTEATE